MTIFTAILLVYVVLDIVLNVWLGMALKKKGSSLGEVVFHIARYLKYGFWLDDYDLEKEGLVNYDLDDDDDENGGYID